MAVNITFISKAICHCELLTCSNGVLEWKHKRTLVISFAYILIYCLKRWHEANIIVLYGSIQYVKPRSPPCPHFQWIQVFWVDCHNENMAQGTPIVGNHHWSWMSTWRSSCPGKPWTSTPRGNHQKGLEEQEWTSLWLDHALPRTEHSPHSQWH